MRQLALVLPYRLAALVLAQLGVRQPLFRFACVAEVGLELFRRLFRAGPFAWIQQRKQTSIGARLGSPNGALLAAPLRPFLVVGRDHTMAGTPA